VSLEPGDNQQPSHYHERLMEPPGKNKTAKSARKRQSATTGKKRLPLESTATRGMTAPSPDNDLHAQLAERVRDARARRFMTRKALAQQSGISLAYLARVESGTGNISLGLLQRLAGALNLPIETFLAPAPEVNADFAMIVEFLKRQSPQRLARIRRQLFNSPDQVQRIALVGIRGVGKSTLGPLLAQRLAMPFIELNREIEKEAGLAVSEIFTLYGQQGYRVLERQCLERITLNHPKVVLATGGGIVAESATYELLLSSFFTIWLKASPEAMFDRVLAQHDARIASVELRHEALENIERTLDARRPLYELARASLDTTSKTVEQIVTELVALLPTTSNSGTEPQQP